MPAVGRGAELCTEGGSLVCNRVLEKPKACYQSQCQIRGSSFKNASKEVFSHRHSFVLQQSPALTGLDSCRLCLLLSQARLLCSAATGSPNQLLVSRTLGCGSSICPRLGYTGEVSIQTPIHTIQDSRQALRSFMPTSSESRAGHAV